MRQPITWLTTDTHFYHHKIIEICNRPHNYNELIIKNLKRTIAKQDTLIHLGDCIFYKYTELKNILNTIPGRKLLLIGNHDHKSKNWYMNSGFAAAMDIMVWGNTLFSHKPQQHLPNNIQYNIHGHYHNTHHTPPPWYNTNTHKLLSIENTNYQPINLKKFLPQTKTKI